MEQFRRHAEQAGVFAVAEERGAGVVDKADARPSRLFRPRDLQADDAGRSAEGRPQSPPGQQLANSDLYGVTRRAHRAVGGHRLPAHPDQGNAVPRLRKRDALHRAADNQTDVGKVQRRTGKLHSRIWLTRGNVPTVDPVQRQRRALRRSRPNAAPVHLLLRLTNGRTHRLPRLLLRQRNSQHPPHVKCRRSRSHRITYLPQYRARQPLPPDVLRLPPRRTIKQLRQRRRLHTNPLHLLSLHLPVFFFFFFIFYFWGRGNPLH